MENIQYDLGLELPLVLHLQSVPARFAGILVGITVQMPCCLTCQHPVPLHYEAPGLHTDTSGVIITWDPGVSQVPTIGFARLLLPVLLT